MAVFTFSGYQNGIKFVGSFCSTHYPSQPYQNETLNAIGFDSIAEKELQPG